MKKIRILAIACAVIVAIALLMLLQKDKKSEVVTVDVVVAINDIAENTILTQELLTLKAVPENMVLSSTYTNVESLVGKMASADIKAGEQIIVERVKEIGDRGAADLSMIVEEGMRAITIAVDTVTGLSNMIHPGDMVDVVAHIEQEKEEDEQTSGTDVENEEQQEEYEMVSVMLVENVQVLAVDNVISSQGKDEYTTVTLMVTPEQVTQIDWSENTGALRVVLRTPLDTNVSGTNKVDISNVVEE